MSRRRGHRDDGDKVPKPSKEARKKAWRIWSYMRPYRWRYFFGLVFLLLTSLVFLAFSVLTRDLVNASKLGEAMDVELPEGMTMTDFGLLLFLILVAQSVFSYFRIYLFASVTENALADLRTDAFNKLIRLPMNYFSAKPVGELNSRMASDISQIQETLTTTLAELIRQIVIVIGGILILFITSWKLTLAMLAVVPLIAIVAVVFGRFIRRLSRQVQDEIAVSTNVVSEALTGIINVKAFTNEIFEADRFGGSVHKIKSTALKAARWRGAFASFIILCIFGSIVGVIWYALSLELSPGDFVMFIMLAMVIGFSFGGLTELYSAILKAVGSIERVFDIIDEAAEPLAMESSDSSLVLEGAISFSDINFTYPSRPDIQVLKNLNFEIQPGEQVAIVGPSGAGKSTITALILRFYQANSGTILFDGKKASDLDLNGLRKNMAIVPQEVLLFGGSIRENIAYGKQGASDDEILEAAKKANALEFIDKFPEKFDTLVGERGVQLSGGQRQRIAIARAVLKNPSILILDEATSSLDSESERLVQDALDKLMKGRTSVVIAHRLSTIKNADKILVLDSGELKEEGSHEELITHEDGLYKHLSSLQFNA